MEQYNSEGQQDTPVHTVKASAEAKQIQTVDASVKQLQQATDLHHQRIVRLEREVTRLKSSISDIIEVLRSRG